MLWQKRIPVLLPAASFGVTGMQIQPMLSRNEFEDHFNVAPEFVSVARLSGIVARRSQAAAQSVTTILETAHVITLPALDGNRYFGQLPKGSFDLNSCGGVLCPCQFELPFDLIFACNFAHQCFGCGRSQSPQP